MNQKIHIPQILFHTDEKTFELFWKTIGSIYKIQRIENTIQIQQSLSIPFQFVSNEYIIPSYYAKKQLHILIIPLNQQDIEIKIKKELKIFKEAKIIQPLVIILLINSNERSYQEIKEFILNEMKSEEFNGNQSISMIKNFSLPSIQQNNSNNQNIHFISSKDLQQKNIQFTILKIPPMHSMRQSIGNKFIGILKTYYYQRMKDWQLLSLEKQNIILKAIEYLKDNKYCRIQQFFSAIKLQHESEIFKNEIIETLNNNGLIYSYNHSEFQNLHQPKLNFLGNLLINPHVYIDVYENITKCSSECKLIDISSLFIDHLHRYDYLLSIILQHFVSINDIFIMDNEMIIESGIEETVDYYFQMNELIQRQQSILAQLTTCHNKKQKHKSIERVEQIEDDNNIMNKQNKQLLFKQTSSPHLQQSQSVSQISFQQKRTNRLIYFQFTKTNDIKEFHWKKKHLENEFEFVRKVETSFPNKGACLLITGLLLEGSQILSHNKTFVILEIIQWKEKGYCLIEKHENSITFHLRTIVTSFEMYKTILQTLNRLYHLLELAIPIKKKYFSCPKCLHDGKIIENEYDIHHLEESIHSLSCKHSLSLIETFPDILYEKYNKVRKVLCSFNCDDDNYSNEIEKYKITEGSFSSIYLSTVELKKKQIKDNNQLKIISKQLHFDQSMELFLQILQQFINEIEVRKTCQSSTLLQLFDYSFDELTLIYEYCDGGSLYQYIDNKQNNPFSKNIQFQLLHEIITAIDILHQHQLIHRDIKSPNILLKSHPFHCVLSDFGLCSSYNETEIPMIDNPIWLAPEILQNHPCTTYSDIYAFGIVLWEICSFQHPFQSYSFMVELISQIIDGIRPKSSEIENETLRELCEKCWNDDMKQRPSSSSIISLLKTIE